MFLGDPLIVIVKSITLFVKLSSVAEIDTVSCCGLFLFNGSDIVEFGAVSTDESGVSTYAVALPRAMSILSCWILLKK